MGKLLDTAAKAGLDAAKPAEETEKLIGNKITKKIVTSKPLPDVNSKNVEEIVISPRDIKQIKKMEHRQTA